jgi:hypothetical protein
VSLAQSWDLVPLRNEADAQRCACFGDYQRVEPPQEFEQQEDLQRAVRERCLAVLEFPDVRLADVLPAGADLSDSKAVPIVFREADVRRPTASDRQVSRAAALPPETARQVTNVLATWREAAAALTSRAMEQLWQFVGGFGVQAAVGGLAAAPEPQVRGLVGGVYHLSRPVDQIPFGVVRVFLRNAVSGQVLATFLWAVPIRAGVRSTRIPVSESLEDDQWEPNQLDVLVIPATHETVVLAWFPADEVRRLLDHPDVQRDANLREEILSLLGLLG